MAKIALLLLVGCISCGLLKLVGTDEVHNEGGYISGLENREENGKTDGQLEESKYGNNVKRLESQPGVGLNSLNSLRSVQTVQCVTCTNCAEVTPNTPSKSCPYTTDNNKQRHCVVYAEKYKNMDSPWYIRGCASERGSCVEIRKAHAAHPDIVTLLNCSECEGDKCNSASSVSKFTMTFLAMVATPLVAKYTLS